MRATTRPLLALALVAATLALTACSPTVALHPADDGVNPVCAQVIVGLPDTVAGLTKRQTNAQGTSAWGDPTSIILHCGVTVPPPTAEYPCISVDGVDWLRNDSEDPNFVFTTYGRDPAIEVVIDSEAVSGLDALTDLSFAITNSPKEGECVSLEDSGK